MVEDVHSNGVDEKAPAIVYWPILTVGPFMFPPRAVTFVVRSSRAGTQAFLNEVQQAVWQVNGELPVAARY